MLDACFMDSLSAAGISYRSVESPALWSHLESHFSESRPIGSRFARLSPSRVNALIVEGEQVLLKDFSASLRKTGKIKRVSRVIDLPYPVGTDAVQPLTKVEKAKVLTLIVAPGIHGEKIVRVLPTAAEDIPCTNQMTVVGGLYPDGRTAGLYDIYPGNLAWREHDNDDDHVILATPGEIRELVREMEEKMDNIAAAPAAKCADMIKKARKALA